MNTPRKFVSWLAPYFERFVALRRATGAKYASQARLLLAFDRYLKAHAPAAPLRCETLVQYLDSLERLSPRGRDNVVGVVWPAVAYALRHEAPGEGLPERPPSAPAFFRQRQPRFVTATEAARLMAAARQLPPPGGLRSATIATLFGLLYTTGIRIGEALGLDLGDVDWHDQLLTIRDGKFGKTRILPLRRSTLEALLRYVEHPRRRVSTARSSPLFVSSRHRRLSYPAVRAALQSVVLNAATPRPWPRPHDFRHSFAIGRVVACYAEGRDVNTLLPALSTYLGHVSIENTRLYLTANGVVLEQGAARFAHHTRSLDEVPS